MQVNRTDAVVVVRSFVAEAFGEMRQAAHVELPEFFVVVELHDRSFRL